MIQLTRLRAVWHGALGLFLAVCVSARGENGQSVRTWRDRDGKNQLQAKLIVRSEETVTLQRADGVEVKVALDRLSAADREFVAKANLLAVSPKATPQNGPGGLDQFVFATWKRDGRSYSVPGLVIQRSGEQSFVLTPIVQEMMQGTGDSFLLSWNIVSGRKNTEGKRVSLLGQKYKCVFAGKSSELPPPLLEAAPVSLTEGMPVRLAGFSLHPSPGVSGFARFQGTGTLQRIFRSQDGQIAKLRIAGDNLRQFHWGLVLSESGQPIACLPQITAENSAGQGASELEVSPLVSLSDYLQPQVQKTLVAPVSGDLNQISYEIAVYLSDPLGTVKSPRLLIKKLAGREAITGISGSSLASSPLEGAEETPLASRPLDPKAADFLAEVLATDPNSPMVAAYKTENPGNIDRHAFQVQVVYSDAGGSKKYLPATFCSYEARTVAQMATLQGKKPLDIPGVDGRPLDMPRLTKHPKGGYLLTGDATREKEAPGGAVAKFPEPEKSGDSLVAKEPPEEGLAITELKIQVPGRTGNFFKRDWCVFSPDGKWLYLIDTRDVLHKIDAQSLTDERTLALPSPATDMGWSQAGLVITLAAKNLVWLITPSTLQATKQWEVPQAGMVACSPQNGMGFVIGRVDAPPGGNIISGMVLCIFDFSQGKLLHRLKGKFGSGGVYRTLQIEGQDLFDGYADMKLTRDGKYLVLGGRRAQRFRVEGTDLVFEGGSEETKFGNSPQFMLSPDGKFLAAYAAYGQVNSGYSIYRIEDLMNRQHQLPHEPSGRDNSFARVLAFGYNGELLQAGNKGLQVLDLQGQVKETHDAKLVLPLQLIPHPDGRRWLCLGERGLSLIELPATAGKEK